MSLHIRSRSITYRDDKWEGENYSSQFAPAGYMHAKPIMQRAMEFAIVWVDLYPLAAKAALDLNDIGRQYH